MLSPSVATILLATAAVILTLATLAPSANASDASAADVVGDIYDTCLSRLSTGCVRPKALRWLSDAVDSDVIRITDDLTIVRTASPVDADQQSRSSAGDLFDGIDQFLATHTLRMSPPAILRTAEARAFGSEQLGLEAALEMPLADGNDVAEGN